MVLVFMIVFGVRNVKPAWRNGRRGRLKIYYSQGCMGSSPIAGIFFNGGSKNF